MFRHVEPQDIPDLQSIQKDREAGTVVILEAFSFPEGS
jgi:hypothetical protein